MHVARLGHRGVSVDICAGTHSDNPTPIGKAAVSFEYFDCRFTHRAWSNIHYARIMEQRAFILRGSYRMVYPRVAAVEDGPPPLSKPARRQASHRLSSLKR